MKINLTSDEINLLVYRYLIENGFVHTAFSFNSEANVPKNPFFATQMEKVPPNALVGFLQKALLYIYLEYHTSDETGEEIRCEEPFSIFKRHECWCRPLEQIGPGQDAPGTQQACADSSAEPIKAADEGMQIAEGILGGPMNTGVAEDSSAAAALPPAKKARKAKSIHSNPESDQVVGVLTPESTEQETSYRTTSPGVPPHHLPEPPVPQVKKEEEPTGEKPGAPGNGPPVGNTEAHAAAKADEEGASEGGRVPPSEDLSLASVPHFKLIRRLQGSNGIREVQFSRHPESPNKLVITWEEGCPELWDVERAAAGEERSLEGSVQLPVFEGGDSIAGTVVSMSQSCIAIGYENGCVALFSYQGRPLTAVRSDQNQESPVVSLKLSESGRFLAIGDAAGSVRVLELSFEEPEGGCSVRLVKSLKHNSAIFGLCWAGNDTFLLSGCLDKQITVFDLEKDNTKVFVQDGAVLSINRAGGDSFSVTCILEGVPEIPVLKASREDAYTGTGCEINLKCTGRILLDGDGEEGRTCHSQANSVQGHKVGQRAFYIVSTPLSVFLFDESCMLIRSQKVSVGSLECNEIVSVCVDDKRDRILVGLNDGSLVFLELSTLRVVTKLLGGGPPSETASSTGVGTVSLSSAGNLVFVGGPDLPAIYILN
ncbi:putative LisH domain-containing protein [Cryptosporidium felis]|nr:putative LisH domain-containing protein [Cryptosporidium felis]